MKCKFCGEELPERGNFCPVCGRDNARDEQPQQDLPEQEQPVVIVPPESQMPEENLEEMMEPEVKKMRRFAVISGCIAVLAVLAVVLFFGIRSGGNFSLDKIKNAEIFRKNTIFKQDSYTVSDKKAQKKADRVVATMGDAELTNGQLQIYYQMEIIEFLNQYGYYLSYFGMDYTQPLDQQVCPLKEGYTWQQFFLECALFSWQQSQALSTEAGNNGFQMQSDYQSKLDSLEADMTATATQNGFTSADAFLQAQCGINTSLADYKAYMEEMFTAFLYLDQLLVKIEVPSDAELTAYYQTNKEALESAGIKQDGSYVVDVRHILIKVDGGVENADGTFTFPDAAVAAEARAKAELILAQWLENPTEENFAALAKEHTADSNGAAGGLYTGVYAGQMVKTFNDWCFDASRRPGDYGIVETKFGYHIMFFSARGEEVWLTSTRDYYMSEQEQKLQEDILAKYDIEVDYKKIALANVDMG